MRTYVVGMHGLGDNVHQRAVIRQLLTRGPVALETPWPSVYWDMVAHDGLLVTCKSSPLRTQAKNAVREAARFMNVSVRDCQRNLRVWYSPASVRRCGSVLHAMMSECGVALEHDDFRLPIPPAWFYAADDVLARLKPDRPIMLYRPLVERSEWSGCAARNPDPRAYRAILESIRRRFYVISVADLEPGEEWLAGDACVPDAQFHAGELPFETLAALASRSALVYCSPGFAVPLAQAVGTPSVCVFGGYENSTSFSSGARWAPYLGIDPIRPCDCFQHKHRCEKAINTPAAVERIVAFVATHCAVIRDRP